MNGSDRSSSSAFTRDGWWWWALPLLACLALYWYGWRASFQMDDFAWLALHRQVHDFPSFFGALFQPLAQGTIRPWSERLFFLLGWEAAGMESAPLLRTIALLTQFANLILLSFLTRRLTGSALAGALASLLWIANANIYIPMAWTAAYNQLLCSFFLLLALWLWTKYLDSGDTRLYWYQFAVFVLGFGALEMNVVYPALAALLALCLHRREQLARTLPMFAVSALYTLLHRAMAPPQRTDIYKMYFDPASLAKSFWQYLRFSFGGERYAAFRKLSPAPFAAAEIIVGVALLAALIWMMAKRRWVAAFGLGWFLIALGPVVPLKNHVSDYYLTIPLIGLCIAGAYAVALAVQSRNSLAIVAAAMVLLMYAGPSAWQGRGMAREYYRVSHRVRTFVRSVAYAHQHNPDKILLIRSMDDEMFWAAWWDNPFQIFGRTDRIYVAAESEKAIAPFPEMGPLTRFFLPEREALEAIQTGKLVAYDLLASGRLRNVTTVYRDILSDQASNKALPWPRRVEPGSALSSGYLGEGWHKPETTFRWTSGRALLQIRGPETDHGALEIKAVCPPQQTSSSPLPVTIRVNGAEIGTANLQAGTAELRFALPRKMANQPVMEVAIETGRTVQAPGDDRRLGVAVVSVEVLN